MNPAMNITDKRVQITGEAKPIALSLTYYYLSSSTSALLLETRSTYNFAVASP